MKNNYIPYIIVFMLCSSCVGHHRIGVQDEKSAEKISIFNKINNLQKQHKYTEMVNLLNDLQKNNGDNYAKYRILNHLSEVYSYNILDIEAAIEIDSMIIKDKEKISNNDVFGFIPKHMVANQVVLADKDAMEQLYAIDNNTLLEKVHKRLSNNKKLLSGQSIETNKKYDVKFLKENLISVVKDIEATTSGSSDRVRMISRFFKNEYEIMKQDADYNPIGKEFVLDKNFDVYKVDLSEIDFISMSDYLLKISIKENNIIFAEYALKNIYRPYIHINSSDNRWTYNNIINNYINFLIEISFNNKNYMDMLYYINLNKSRMLLEDRAGLSSKSLKEVFPNELPSKTDFLSKIAKQNNYIDFYVGGKFTKINKQQISATQQNIAYHTLSQRDFGSTLESTNKIEEIFIDDAVYVTFIENGNIQSAKKIFGNKLVSLKESLDKNYDQISTNGKDQALEDAKRILIDNKLIMPSLTVSPDKWLNKYPMDLLFNTSSVRSVNLFLNNPLNELYSLNIKGFFNPTSDLPWSEKEIDFIKDTKIAKFDYLVGQEATLIRLDDNTSANIIHLSMHGLFNNQSPLDSRLAFNGAKRGNFLLGDKNSLYARDMYKYQILKNKDLIFAAACQSGLADADRVNENEAIGILRPLIANNNKNIIMTLWKVDDRATSRFVEVFYDNLGVTKDVKKAFFAAQQKVKIEFKKPYYWAAFYLLQS